MGESMRKTIRYIIVAAALVILIIGAGCEGQRPRMEIDSKVVSIDYTLIYNSRPLAQVEWSNGQVTLLSQGSASNLRVGGEYHLLLEKKSTSKGHYYRIVEWR